MWYHARVGTSDGARIQDHERRCPTLHCTLGWPVTPDEVAAAFDAAPVARMSEWLAALAALGQARVGDDGRYVTA